MHLPASPAAVFGVVSAFFVVVTGVALALGYALEAHWKRRIWALPLDPGQTAAEVRGNAIFLVVNCAAATLALTSGAVRLGDDTVSSAVATAMAFSASFQVWFYVMHRGLHHPRLVRFHRHHHRSRVTTPLSGQSSGWVESMGWAVGYVGLPVLLSQVHPLSLVGVVAYLVFNVIGNIVGHANVELVPTSSTLWWRSTLATVFTYHALHHARWTGHFGFASTWADRLLHTEWPDWPALHKQVWSGQPMTSLKDKGDNIKTPSSAAAAAAPTRTPTGSSPD